MLKRSLLLAAALVVVIALAIPPAAHAGPASSFNPLEPVWSWLHEMWSAWSAPGQLAGPELRSVIGREGAGFDPNGAPTAGAGGGADPDGSPLAGAGAGFDPDGYTLQRPRTGASDARPLGRAWGRAGVGFDPNGVTSQGFRGDVGSMIDPSGRPLRQVWGKEGVGVDPDGRSGAGAGFDPNGVPGSSVSGGDEGPLIDPSG